MEEAMSEADAARMLAKRQRRAKRNKKLASYGTKAERKQYAIKNNLHRPPPRRQNVAATQHQRDQNNLVRHIADAQARLTANNTNENHDHLMSLTKKLAHVVQQDDLHAPTHATTEHVKKRPKKSKAARERAEAHRQYIEDNPLSPAQRAEKAAVSRARREAAGGDKAYQLQKKANKRAERLARDEEADSLVGSTPAYFDQMKKQEAERKRMFEKLPALRGGKDPETGHQYADIERMGGQLRVPNAYAID